MGLSVVCEFQASEATGRGSVWSAPEEQYPRLSFGLHSNAHTRACTPPHIFVYTRVYTHINTVGETI